MASTYSQWIVEKLKVNEIKPSNMKKIVTLLASSLICLAAWAQTPENTSCLEEDKCPLEISLTRTLQSSNYPYTLGVYVDDYAFTTLALAPSQQQLDTTLLFCPGRRVEMWTSNGGEDFAGTITDPFGNVTESSNWGLSYYTRDVCAQQCELTLEIGANAQLENIANPEWLEIYAGDDEYPLYTFYRSDCYWCGETVNIPVSAGVPLRIVWHEPDSENHQSWFSLYDPAQQRMIVSKYSGDELSDGEIATYTPDCGASCTDNDKCPLQVTLTRTPYSSYDAYRVNYEVDGMLVGSLELEPSESRLDTTLLFCPGRPVNIWTNNGGEDFAGSVTDPFGNVTESSNWGVNYSTRDVCVQQCNFAMNIGTQYYLEDVYYPWVAIYAGDDEYPLYEFNQSWTSGGQIVPLSLPADIPLRFVWHEPDSANFSSWCTIYDYSGNVVFEKQSFTEIPNGNILNYTASCGNDSIGNIVYVKQDGTGSGSSWEDAVSSIEAASMIALTHGADVWVAAGTYYGDTTAENAFLMVDGVNVYGGFAGNEPADYDLSQRDFGTNTTILDGMNARRVLYQPSSFNTLTTWDGFTIQNGHTLDYYGYGAGAYLYSNGKIGHCIVRNNTSYYGGGVYAGYYSTLSNCLVANNTASYTGGGVYSYYATITNSTIVRNTANNGAGVYGDYGGKIFNSIVWGNGTNEMNNISGMLSSCSYSAIEGGYSGEHNIMLSEQFNQQPWFVQPSQTSGVSESASNADWHLLDGSPCINRGNNAAVADSWDLGGMSRIQRDTVDMGCYESDYYSTPIILPDYSNIIYVTQEGAGSQTGESWENATPSLYFALSVARTYHADVWVAAGTYYGDTTSENAFLMVDGVNVYGGFAGNEPADYGLSQRDFETNTTILDGMNARRVLYQSSSFNTLTAWDGFTIQNGRATNYGNGGGVYMNNRGRLSHCIIRNNTAYYGGGVYAYSSTLSNCLVLNNTATYTGGGVYSRYVTISNSTIVRNAANNGAGIYGEYGGNMTNSIVWGNGTNEMNNIIGTLSCSYSAIEGGYFGEHNILLSEPLNQEPMFVSPSLTSGVSESASVADWHLLDGSPCINRGNNAAVADSLDLGGMSRIQRDTVDMGCYESEYYSIPVITPNYTNIIYVTQEGAGSLTGESWENATSSLSFALSVARAYHADVWVASGIYYGDTAATSENAFTMVEGVNVYGGFAGNEPADYDLSQRDFETNTTILDGMNARRVLYQSSSFNTLTTWDGFTIQNGRAPNYGNGGGVYMNNRGELSHCVIRNNTAYSGGGVYVDYYGIINNCMVTNNTASYTGGGVYTYYGTVSNCRVSNNTANYGGGVYAGYNSTLSNCLVSNNTATYTSGGVYSYYSTITNTTIVRNAANNGAGIYGEYGGNLTNSIVWGNGTNEMNNITGTLSCSYSAIELGYEGEGNVSLNDCTASTLFVNPALSVGVSDNTENVDWHLQEGSVCVNRGSNAAVIDTLDLDGTTRIKHDMVDMGCYESDYLISSIPPIPLPVAQTNSVTGITATSAVCGGDVTSDCNDIVAYGVCWNTSSNPTLSNSYTVDGAGNGSFSSVLSGLTPNTTYYVRAYATNSEGTAYGEEVSFITECNSVTVSISGNSYATDATIVLTAGDVWGDGTGYQILIDADNIGWTETYGPDCGSEYTIWEYMIPANASADDAAVVFNATQSINIPAGTYSYLILNPGCNDYGTNYIAWNQCDATNATDFFFEAGKTYTFTPVLGGPNSAGNDCTTLTITDGNITAATENNTIYINYGQDTTLIAHGAYTYQWSTGESGESINVSPTTTTTYSVTGTNQYGCSATADIIVIVSALPTVTTDSITAVTSTTAIGGGNVIGDGIATVIERGVCWSTSPAPTLDDNHTVDGAGLGGFTSSITGLAPNTTYYVRAYATNSEGTAYGEEVSFTTLPDYYGIIYVTQTGAGNRSGNSWENATSSIDTAQALAQTYDAVVWVAAGTYYGDTTSTSDNAFTMHDGVNVYGGFAGNEPADYDLSQRDFEANATILDGQNARRVLYQPSDFNNQTEWNGFTIQHGFVAYGSVGGGGVYLQNRSVLMSCIIINNEAVRQKGGGICASSSIINNCQISNNIAHDSDYGDNGGGIYATNSIISNCQISSNTAQGAGSLEGSLVGCGGGIYALFSTISNCHIHNNKSSVATYETYGLSVHTQGGHGGGVYAENSTIDNCQILNNSSHDIHTNLYGNTELRDRFGSGIYAQNTIISRCRISHNSSYGAIYANNSTINDCQITYNTTCGIVADNSTINNSIISNNINSVGGSNGGGLRITNSDVNNSLICNNTADYGQGGGVYTSSSTIVNSTIVRNSSGVFGSASLTNCIIWGNERNGTPDNLNGCSCTYSAVEGGYSGEGNILLADHEPFLPLFVNPSLTAGAEDSTLNVDWHLLQGSVCVNRGNNAAVTDSLDLDGNARIQRDTVDLGCYESDYLSSPILLCVDVYSEIPHSACDSYSWNGQSFTESGEYSQTFELPFGCDSIVTLHLTIHPSPTVTITGSNNINYGQSTTLMASGADIYTWSNNGVSISNNDSVTISPEETTTYFVTGYDVGGTNLVVNGDFEQGNIDFATDYSYVNDGYYGHYYIAHDNHEMWSWDNDTIFDHTTGSGLWMMVDAYSGRKVWSQTVEVIPNRDYVFSAWFVTDNIANVRFEINDQQSDIFTTPQQWGVWERKQFVWNSGSNTTANIKIVTGFATSNGNDFGIDDISFTELNCESTESITVNVTTLPPVVTTGTVSDINSLSATCIGNVISDGGEDVTSRGICWNTFQNPTITDSHTTEGMGTGEFTSIITNLEPFTTYYVRAYATNAHGTSYGNEEVFTTLPDYRGVIYVTPTGAGNRTGDSWENATSSIDTAQTLAQTYSAVVWVAAGTYYGDTTSTSENAFTMVEGVNVYGGFAGDEPADYDLSQRDFGANATILDGMNARRVLKQPSSFNTQTTWNGFALQNGQTSGNGGGAYLQNKGVLSQCEIMGCNANGGGGVYVSAGTISECLITDCTASNGGGVNCTNKAVISSCRIAGNNATGAGGGVYTYNSTIVDCDIIDNETSGSGGGVYCYYSTHVLNTQVSPSDILRCIISGNHSSNSGGGVCFGFANDKLNNCLVSNNSSNTTGGGVFGKGRINNTTIVRNYSTGEGGGLNAGSYNSYYSGNIMALNNCVVWGNVSNGGSNNIKGSSNTCTCSYSAIEEGYSGTGNILLDETNQPHFVNSAHTAGFDDSTDNVDWHLQQASVCINRGDNSAVTDTLDLDGNARIQRDTVDMGCYESDYYSVPMTEYDSIIYVTVTGAGTQLGNSWANATSSIEEAQTLAQTYGAVVWVAAGTYYGDTVSTSNNAFTMVDGVNVYGGFAGNEPADYDLSQRDFEANATILDGQNARRVLNQPSSFNAQTTWNGFVMQNGQTSGNGGGAYLQNNGVLSQCKIIACMAPNGGGVYNSRGTISECIISSCSANEGGGVNCTDNATISSCILSNNNATTGGGVFSYNSSIVDCDITMNVATGSGGGVYCYYRAALYFDVDPTNVIRCRIVGNQASNGGGICLGYGNDKVRNCLISNNTANMAGGGIIGKGHVYNTTIVRNTSTDDGAGVNGSTSTTLTNCIVWGNERNGDVNNLNGSSIVCSYSAIEGGYMGDNISLLDETNLPMFVNPSITAGAEDNTANVDWHLQQGSVCVNRGNNSAVTDTLDLDGTARIKRDTVDLGCYESDYYSIPVTEYNSIIYVTVTGAGTQSGDSWANATSSIDEAQTLAQTYDAVVWVAAGTYYGDTTSNAFTMRDGVSVYGGFVGNEPANYDLSQRDFETNTTILDGQNARHVLYQPYEFNNRAEWNGFTIRNGQTSGSGAGAYLQRNAMLSQCRVEGNTSTNGSGGGVYCNNAIVDHCEIVNNSCRNSGGGVYASSSELSDCRIESNTATTSSGGGGGVYAISSTIANCYITDNQSAGNGGGAWSYNTQFTYCNIFGNNTTGSGGGVYSHYSTHIIYPQVAPTIISCCQIHGNQSGNSGGGIRMGYHNDKVLNSLVCNNTSGNAGGGINGNGKLVNTTVVCNLSNGNGGGLAGDIDLKNCIVWGNKRYGVTDNISGNSVSCSYSAIEGGFIGEGNFILGEANSEAENSPCFANPTTGPGAVYDNGDWHLLPQSICINVGDPNTAILSETDLDGLPRLQQSRVDMGCYEYQNVTVPIEDTVIITVVSDNIMRGVATGSGIYNSGDTVVLRAVPSQYARFLRWNDNDTNNPRMVIADTNTTFTATFDLDLPELHVTSITHSDMIGGESATVSWTVRNDGNVSTPDGVVWYDRVWLSLDPKVDVNIGSPILLGAFPNVSALAPDEYYTQTRTVDIPLQVSGDYYLFVIADCYDADQIFWENGVEEPYNPPTFYGALSHDCGGADCENIAGNKILEISEYDNYSRYPYYHDNFFYETVEVATPAYPDLVVTHVVPSSYPFLSISELTQYVLIHSQMTQITLNFYSGSEVTLSYRVLNDGNYDTRVTDWRDVIFISNHSEFDETAQALNVVSHSGLLLPDSSYLMSTTVIIPLEIYDTAYFYVYTDFYDQVYEHIGRYNNVTRSGAFNVILTPPADLVPRNITADRTVSTGATFNFSYEIHNRGAGEPNHTSWRDRCYLSTNPNSITNAVQIADDWHSGGIAVGGFYAVQHSISLPSNLSQGTYYLFVKSDALDNVFEYTMEDNNLARFVQPISVLQPDLQIPILNVADTLHAGAEASVSYQLANTGDGAVVNRNVTDRFYLSQYSNGSNATQLPQFTSNLWLNAHDSTTKYQNVMLPSDLQDGIYYLFARTNVNNDVNEANTNNNQSLIKQVYINHQLLPDLVITSVTAPDTLTAGASATFTATVANHGERPTALGNLDFRLSAAATPNNILCTTENVSSESQSLAVGDSTTFTMTIRISPAVNNPASFTLTVNPGHTISESSYSNNGYAFDHAVQPYPFDLAVTDLSSPNQTISGEYIPVTWTVQNKGTVPMLSLPMYMLINLQVVGMQTSILNQPWDDRIYLSSDTLLDANDVQIGNYSRYQTLLAGNSYTANLSCRIPVSADGNYYVLVVSDATNVTFDSQRANNVAASPIAVTQSALPDLQMDTLIALNTLTTGENYTLRYTVSNHGEHITHDNRWTDAFYINNIPSLQDAQQLGSKIHNGQLDVSASYSDMVSVTIPNTWEGNCYLIGYTDATDQIFEMNSEDNNLFILPVSVVRPLPCDLTVLPPDFPQEAIVGENVQISWTLQNIGLNTAQGNIKDAVYLSTDSTWSSDDIMLGSVTHNVNLPANGQQQRDATFPLQGVPVGDYYVMVRTNILNALNENSYTNNKTVSLMTMHVDYPSLYIDQEEHRQLRSGQSVYYKLEVGPELANQTLSCKLSSASQNVANGLYIAYSSAPSASNFDWSATMPYVQEQEILIPSLNQGTYYIMATGHTSNNSSQSVTLLATIINFEIISVNANSGANTGSVTTQIIGAKFDTIMDFRLANSNGYLPAEKIFFNNSTETYATFNLRDQQTGVYDMVAELPGGIITVKGQAFVVEQGLPAELLSNIIAPASVRNGNTFTVTIEYGNNGSTDLDISGFLLVSTNGFPIAFTSDSLANNATELTFETGEPHGNPDVMRPGYFATKTIFVKANRVGNINLKLYPIRRRY